MGGIENNYEISFKENLSTVTGESAATKTKTVDCYVIRVPARVKGGSETSNVARIGDGGTDEKTGGGDGVRSDKN